MKHLLIMFLPLLLLCSCSKNDSVFETELPTESDLNFQIIVGSATFFGSFYTTEAAEAFRAMLPFTATMGDMNKNEKHCELSQNLPTLVARPGTIRNGDLMLYGSQTLVLFYKTFSSSYNYTRIGRVDNPSGLEAALGGGNISVTFEQAPQAIQYTLTYNANGSTSGTTPSAVVVDGGSRITLNNGVSLSRDGYTFTGWNTDANGAGTDYPAESNYVINSNVTLYAKWQAVTNSSNIMKITIGSTTFSATLASNTTVTAFKAMLPLTFNMSDFNSNEKVCSLPNSLSTSASNPGTIHTGDIMLYGSSSLVLFYETFTTSYNYTRIGRVNNPSELKTALGLGNVNIKFELE